MCIFHHSHSDILPMTSHISTCVHIHIQLCIYTTPYSFINAILCKYTKYTIINYIYTYTTYIHTLHPALHIHTHKYSLMCMQPNIHHAYTHRVNTTNQIGILTCCGTCVHA